MNDQSSSNGNPLTEDKAKPTVFYATKSNVNKPNKRSKTERDKQSQSSFAKRNESRKPYQGTGRADRSHNHRENDNRIETFKPRSRHLTTSTDSPWKSRVQKSEQLNTFENDHPASFEQQIRRQRKQETLVYSENSCKAVFAKRPESIIKAFFLEEKTYEFKALIAWLVEHRLGYDIIDEERMNKIAQTPHHGGVCLIVKKRATLSTGNYLSQHIDDKKNYVLAIDDINNPHNLGAIARTAAFFNVNGLLLRQPDLLDNGACLRVSEGGSEYLEPIHADDFIASLDQFKQQGYQIIALLPCKINSLKAENLAKLSVSAKTVFVIFQHINTKLANFADKIVYLPGSDIMPALNISVLTGILLTKLTSTNAK